MTVERFSISFTLGKASAAHGANVNHNNRKFLADNINPAETSHNISYKMQSVESAYQELFGEAVKEYNERQKRPCRRIADYYSHIANGHREEPFYEAVVQFGDCRTVQPGTQRWYAAQTMLNDYMRGFQKRNPNLYVFNAVLHLDEASPHLHIDFIPFYTKERQRGLKKGVSMRAALIEQGFVPEHNGKNQLTLWEESERREMERTLHYRGFIREDKHADYAHMSVGEYKTLQDSRRMEALLRQTQTVSKEEATRTEVYRLKEELQASQQTVRMLEAEKESPYVKFFYATDDKQAYVIQQLEQMGIPFRETENGFEAQECHIKTIRSIEKNYHGQPVSFREQLKEDIDRCMLGAKDFRDFLQKLSQRGYMIRTGKFIAAKPWNAERYIRFKSLGEYYSEQALRNRLLSLKEYKKQLAEMIEEAKAKKAPNVMVLVTERQYMECFIEYRLPIRKRRQDRPLTWVNDAELDKLTALNEAINNGETVDTIRRRFHELTEKEKAAEREAENLGYMSENYAERLAAARAHLEEVRAELKEAAERLEMVEKIMNGTYVQDMLDKFSDRKRAEIVPNGYHQSGGRRR
ncbi:MAG: plasmid recombination protein [Oscillospiraceae bacterium]|nr:plasmid recombination protein [Oscillospiraceae bacterium]